MVGHDDEPDYVRLRVGLDSPDRVQGAFGVRCVGEEVLGAVPT